MLIAKSYIIPRKRDTIALLDITLNQDETLQLLENVSDTAFAKLLQDSLNSILNAEFAAQLNAEPVYFNRKD